MSRKTLNGFISISRVKFIQIDALKILIKSEIIKIISYFNKYN